MKISSSFFFVLVLPLAVLLAGCNGLASGVLVINEISATAPRESVLLFVNKTIESTEQEAGQLSSKVYLLIEVSAEPLGADHANVQVISNPFPPTHQLKNRT